MITFNHSSHFAAKGGPQPLLATDGYGRGRPQGLVLEPKHTQDCATLPFATVFLPISTQFYQFLLVVFRHHPGIFGFGAHNKELELVFRLQGFGPCTGGNLRLIRPHSAAALKSAYNVVQRSATSLVSLNRNAEVLQHLVSDPL